MRKLSSLLDMDKTDSLESEITSCIQNARKQRFLMKKFIYFSNQYVTPQKTPWEPVASVGSQGKGNVTASSSSLRYSHANIGSPKYNRYSANYGGH